MLGSSALYLAVTPDTQFVYQDGDAALKVNGNTKNPWIASEYVPTTYDSLIHDM
ncbi:hypothetical protein Pogu_1140 [Pyrobaculum oguniense TE7]|uniref:Uncharacterized protein n=1 Tax=Pyrobaculum oguniense (strain DSM 13380 / JCM 10595 / TE7) TaxID=698757 RepID=H6QA45_PYROT|nr:hypothetical protein Pogu_1140 [Pyrobaculum oguniense TE7]